MKGVAEQGGVTPAARTSSFAQGASSTPPAHAGVREAFLTRRCADSPFSWRESGSLLSKEFVGVPGGFTDLQAPVVIGSTIVFLLLALLAFVLVGRFARRPVWFYRILALVALLVSFLNPIMLLNGAFPAPGMNLHIFWTMIVMH